MLSAPAVCADILFAEWDVARLLSDTQTSSSLRSQQVLVDVASRSAAPLGTLLLGSLHLAVAVGFSVSWVETGSF